MSFKHTMTVLALTLLAAFAPIALAAEVVIEPNGLAAGGEIESDEWTAICEIEVGPDGKVVVHGIEAVIEPNGLVVVREIEVGPHGPMVVREIYLLDSHELSAGQVCGLLS